jgi:hypothetical protein
VALTGEQDAGKLLEYGYRRHLFVSRRDGDEPTYEFHALFREFLLKRAPSMFTAGELAGYRRRAAELAEARGAGGTGEGVFELYRDAGDWTNAVRSASPRCRPPRARPSRGSRTGRAPRG